MRKIESLEIYINKTYLTQFDYHSWSEPVKQTFRNIVAQTKEYREHYPITIQTIVNKVYFHFGIDKEFVYTKSRKHKYVLPRQICHHLATELKKYSPEQIAHEIGKLDRCSVYHSVTAINNKLETDKNFNEEYELIKSKL